VTVPAILRISMKYHIPDQGNIKGADEQGCEERKIISLRTTIYHYTKRGQKKPSFPYY
jgi:hypothetical protein